VLDQYIVPLFTLLQDLLYSLKMGTLGDFTVTFLAKKSKSMVINQSYHVGGHTFVYTIGTDGNHPMSADDSVHRLLIVSELLPNFTLKPRNIPAKTKAIKSFL
jgi:hypothetical protein